MRALRFGKVGSLDGLTLQEIPKPTAGLGEVLVQVKAAAAISKTSWERCADVYRQMQDGRLKGKVVLTP